MPLADCLSKLGCQRGPSKDDLLHMLEKMAMDASYFTSCGGGLTYPSQDAKKMFQKTYLYLERMLQEENRELKSRSQYLEDADFRQHR